MAAQLIGPAIAGALTLGKGLFGTASRQDQNQRQFTQFRPQDIAAIEAARGGVVGGTQGLLDQLTRSREALQQGFLTPQTGFMFSQTPDAMTRALAATGAQGLSQQTAAQQRQIAQQFRNEPGAARALQSQAMIASRLQQNPLLMQAMQQQQGRELAQAQQQMSQIDAVNRALLAREQALTGLAGTGVSAQGNLLAQQLGLGQALGEQISQSLARGRSGGLLSK